MVLCCCVSDAACGEMSCGGREKERGCEYSGAAEQKEEEEGREEAATTRSVSCHAFEGYLCGWWWCCGCDCIIVSG